MSCRPSAHGIWFFLWIIPALGSDEPPFSDEPMMVTASRTQQPAAAVPARVSVITRDDIERIQPPDLLELLRLQAGVDMARAGGPGAQTGVFLRGSNSNHVLVLIDGVRVSAAGTGAFTWEILDPALIERIEIVRGPRAARWGSDAIGGVIQIFTRRSDGPWARASYGRFRDRSLSVAIGDQSGPAPHDLSASVRRVGGFSAQNERGFAFDPDNDGFRNAGANAGGRYRLGGGELAWRGRVAAGEIEFDQGESDFTNYSGTVEYFHRTAGAWQWLLSAGTLRDRLETETPFGVSEDITRRVQAGFQAERALGADAAWMVGADAWRESGISRGVWAESRYNLGVWTGMDGRRADVDYELSLRVDEDENFGSAVTGNAGAGWWIGPRGRLFTNLGRGFRSPNFNQLFSLGFSGLFAGNTELDPEASWSLEVGADWSPADGHLLTVSVYENRIDDLIDFAGENFQAINIREARIRGLEAGYRLTGPAWRVEASATWQDPEDRDTGNDLLRRPREKYNLVIDRRLSGRHWLGAEIVHTGSRFDVGGVELPSHTLLNLRAGFGLGSGFGLSARLENALDRDYEPLFGFNAHRRSLFVALAWEG